MYEDALSHIALNVVGTELLHGGSLESGWYQLKNVFIVNALCSFLVHQYL